MQDVNIKTKIHKKHMLTPLRYPGGKTSLFGFFDTIIKENELKNVNYIEPYAGGAGAAISLLLLGKVNSIVINDYDKAIYAFWKSITENTDDFIRRIRNTPINIDEWHKQKAIYKNGSKDLTELGIATFYLNRTNRSGILTAGPIGGLAQDGEWRLDARFNRERLIDKIKLIGTYQDKIKVLNEDGLDVIRRFAQDSNSFFYIDPPYYYKGSLLYLSSYNHNDHASLAKLLNSLSNARWILSYDNVPQIHELYKTRPQKHEFSLHYQAHSSKEGSELMIFSDILKIPRQPLS